MHKFYIFAAALIFIISACSDKSRTAADADSQISLSEIHKQAVISSVQSEIPNEHKYQRIIMELELDPEMKHYTVKQKIYYTNNYDHPLDEIYFRTHMGTDPGIFDLHSYHVSGHKTALINVNSQNYFLIEFSAQIAPGVQVEIMLNYSVTIPAEKPKNSRLFAFYDNSLMFDYFYPSLMVYGRKGWDLSEALPYGDLTYNEAALFEVTVSRPEDFLYASTGTVTGSEKSFESDIVIDRIVTGPVRSFFLAGGFDWIKYSVRSGETEISVFGSSDLAGKIENSLTVVKQAFETMSSVLTVYPYTEFDVVFIPAGWSAMEYPGIIAVGENYLNNFPPEYKTLSFRNAEFILVHELVHQWFFNIVGNDQINDPWLDESFTQYMVKYYFQIVYGPEKAEEYVKFLKKTAADTVGKDIPVNLSVGGYKNSSEYTRAVYGKAPLFFHSLKQKAGTSKFLEFVKWYLDKHSWQIVDTEHFMSDLDEFFGENTIDGFMSYFEFE